MVRSYLRHEPTLAYGLICSPTGRSLLSQDGKTAVVPALEDVLVWDVKTGEQMGVWHEVGHSSPVTAMNRNPNQQAASLYAVGYADGSIRIWDADTSTAKLTLNGHKGAITALQFDLDGLTLASGSQDSDLILWDIIAEAGLFRLKGHRDAVTAVRFVYGSGSDLSPSTSSDTQPENRRRYLASTSKDGLLKLWDVPLQHCVETVLPGRGELWSLSVLQDFPESTANNDVGALILVGNAEGKVNLYEASKQTLTNSIQGSSGSATKFFEERGQLDLVGTKRVTQIEFEDTKHSTGRLLAISGSDRSVELFRLRSEDDIRKKLVRRRRRAKEKAAKKQGSGAELTNQFDESESQVTWSDRIEPYTILRPNAGKLKSFAFAEGDNDGRSSRSNAPILLALGNNSLEIHSISAPKKGKAERENQQTEANLACALEVPGHRSGIRAMALSSDDKLLACADSEGSLKVWNTLTGRVLRSLPCGYALSLAWLPDDSHVIAGCKDGTLRTYNIPSGTQLEDISAHQGPVWSVVVHPSGTSCLSASGDKDVKFWDFEARQPTPEAIEVDQDGEQPSPRLTTLGLTHTRTLKMTDDVLCARYSPDGRLLALSLLDSTVKVFYSDSLKFFLSLYGHKLPVLSLDISGDNKLCVTVSADKNAKIWGLDFGDCHRSLFAHEESVIAVAFEKGDQGGGLLGGREGKSHHFWTCAKDGKLKYWDGDRFQCIQTMSGHHGDVSALAVGSRGTVVVSAGADRSIRVWEKTDEPLFLEEERERELEEMYQNGNAAERNDEERGYGSLADRNDLNDENQQPSREAEDVQKSTKETLMAGERLMEAIEIADADIKATKEYEESKKNAGLDLAPPAKHPLLAHTFEAGEEVDAYAYVLKITTKILPGQLEDALLVLPFDFVVSLMKYIDYWAGKEWNISLVARILFFLLRNYHSQIVATRLMRSRLISLRGHLQTALRRQKMTIGYNIAGMDHVKTRLQENLTGELYEREGFDADEARVKEIIARGQGRKRKVVI